MEMKINKNIYLKLIAVLLCIYIAISSFCQPKKVYANPVLLGGIAITLIAGMIAAGYARDAVVPAERLNELNEQATANLQSAFPNPAEYNQQLGILENLSNDLLAGKDVDWSKYSGKAIYAISKAVIDVLYPYSHVVPVNEMFLGSVGSYSFTFQGIETGSIDLYQDACFPLTTPGWQTDSDGPVLLNRKLFKSGQTLIVGYKKLGYIKLYQSDSLKNGALLWADSSGANAVVMNFYGGSNVQFLPTYQSFFIGHQNVQYVPNITAKTTNKVKLPTRLPPSVINNYNNYIDGSVENLIINPTEDELPQLPDNYNPVTDDPPDLDGYQDVTPDQEPSDTPDPTPTSTPTPSTPEYDGSSWIKPIGDFFAGLLSFLKDALIPTQTVDFSPLQNMSTDFANKFPFSLPGDIGKLFGVLQAEPRRPEFQMTFDLSKVGVPGDPIVWDLKFEQWDGAAAIVKTALYIGFLIGLVFISKNFMKN